MSALTAQAVPPGLRCLGGAPPPAGAMRHWQALQAWPTQALVELWTFLKPLVENPRGPQPAESLRQFCERHSLARTEVGEVGTLVHNLLLRAAAIDLPETEFSLDLDALGGGNPAAVILANFGAAKQVLRSRLLHAALSSHGKLMTGASWRMDTVGDTDGAKALAAPVLVLTLDWQEGGAGGRTTLQLTPAMIRLLRGILQQV